MDAETFRCPNCSADIPVEDVRRTAATVCLSCGRRYRIEYDELMESYRLRAEEPHFPMDIDTVCGQ